MVRPNKNTTNGSTKRRNLQKKDLATVVFALNEFIDKKKYASEDEQYASFQRTQRLPRDYLVHQAFQLCKAYRRMNHLPYKAELSGQ